LARPSSTSSSEQPTGLARLPWGGILALALGLLGQHLALNVQAPWAWLLSHEEELTLLEQGLLIDRREMVRAAATTGDRPRVALVGTSRMESGFREQLVIPELQPPIEFFRHTHPRMYPHEIASQASEILALEPDVVVFTVSEFELLTPLRLVPQGWGGDLDALFDLMGRTGPVFVFQQRDAFLRMLCAGLSDAYRYRSILGKTLLPQIRDVLARADDETGANPHRDATLADGTARPAVGAEFERLIGPMLRQFPDRKDTIRSQSAQVRGIRPGAHAKLKMDIMQRNIETFRDAGVQVMLFEGALHPDAATLYDSQASRSVFLAWARTMAEREGVHFMPREDLGEIPAEEFRDVTHVNKLGALRVTLVLMDWCARVLTPQWRQALGERPLAPEDDHAEGG